MGKVLKTVLIIVGVLIVLGAMLVSPYNKMVQKDEGCSKAWADVENAYQRRMDLIPNLVKTVQGAADYEKGTLTEVIEARAKATSVQVDPSNLTEESIAKFQAAQDQLSSALSRLMVVVERYPELKANQNFLELQAQLEGTENRIAVERGKFNETVNDYNSYIRRFPNNIIAGMFNFDKKGYFKATEGADKAPDVEFNFN
ncbi:MAG: LemA family protein [Bacteroidales bacterium]|jgi:LemA protein|nr:LemA family protein [Bacteroidales bacterium]MBR4637919.1 LemA family protein [Bacteroidales bacterium]MBR5922048.1 LemA family protein [Bacteroidales bacterium]MBR6904051.1 LemA family protein [Bacteroidales bacterium]MCR4872496.1 LemA family protein [Bacteroidales bacterium]